MNTLKRANALDEVNKSKNVHLLKIMPHKKCTVLKYIYAKFPHHKFSREPNYSNPAKE